MSDVNNSTIEHLQQFTDDLESGDLTGYRITKLQGNPDGTVTRTVTETYVSDVKPKVRSDPADIMLLLMSAVQSGYEQGQADKDQQLTEKQAEVERLKNWKSSAMQLFAEWDRVFAALGSPGRLGESTAAESLVKVNQLVAEVERLKSRLESVTCPIPNMADYTELQQSHADLVGLLREAREVISRGGEGWPVCTERIDAVLTKHAEGK